MQRLAKVGFNQCYTYFTWRQSAWELRTYFEELATADRRLHAPERAGRTRPTSSPSSCRRAARRCSPSGPSSPPRCHRRGASTGRRSSCWSTCRCAPAARSTSTRRSTSCASGTSHRPDSLAPAARPAQPHPARGAGARTPADPALPRHRRTTPCCATRRPTRSATAPPVLVVVNLDAHQRQHGLRRRRPAAPLGPAVRGRRLRRRRVTTC